MPILSKLGGLGTYNVPSISFQSFRTDGECLTSTELDSMVKPNFCHLISKYCVKVIRHFHFVIRCIELRGAHEGKELPCVETLDECTVTKPCEGSVDCFGWILGINDAQAGGEMLMRWKEMYPRAASPLRVNYTSTESFYYLGIHEIIIVLHAYG